MMQEKDYYAILELKRDAAQEEIKKAFRRLAVKYHPDRNRGDKGSEEKFKDAQEAYEVLKDPQKRYEYDHFGLVGARGPSSRGSGGAFEDIFTDFFDDFFGGGSRRGRKARRGADLRYDLEITLEEAFNGIEKTIEIPRERKCYACNGTGAKNGASYKVCQTCNGVGQVRYTQAFFTVQKPCSSCRGTGKIIEEKCEECKGQGRVIVKESYNVSIPKGAYEGLKFRFEGEGEYGLNGGSSGDLYILTKFKPHEVFNVNGLDLHMTLNVHFIEVALGCDKTIQTLEGLKTVHIPQGGVSESIIKITKSGLYIYGRRNRGDLYVHLNVKFPKKLMGKQREMLLKLAEEFSLDANSESENGIFDRIKGAFS